MWTQELNNENTSLIHIVKDLHKSLMYIELCYNISSTLSISSSSSSSLWKYKFIQRWNYIPSQNNNTEIINWNEWYRNMYNNPNDLWIFYENITWPNDGYIDGYTNISNTTSRESFQKFHNDIDIQQYMSMDNSSSSLTVCSDLLFFPIYDTTITSYNYLSKTNNYNTTKHHTNETRRLLEISEDMILFKLSSNNTSNNNTTNININNKLTALGVAYHSWFVLKIINPQYIRPIHFKIYIQTDPILLSGSATNNCLFTIFPNEGYLLPGQEINIVFGVSNYGSWLSFIQQCIITRPIFTQYWYRKVIPCNTNNSCSNINIERRNIYLNAHIHPYYTLDEFHVHTLQTPITIKQQKQNNNNLNYH